MRANANKNYIRGFTLLELMVVIAITALLFTLIFGPLIQSFNLTNRARTQIESQTAARQAMALLTHDLSDAVYVFDNAQTPLNLWLTDATGNSYVYSSLFTMIEYVLPARQEDQTPGNIPLDPTTGLPIYNGLSSGQSGFAVPLAPGRSLTRVFLGLQKNAATTDTTGGTTGDVGTGMPQKPYGDIFTDVGQGYFKGDNRYALFRAEVTVYVADPEAPPGTTPVPYVVDQRLFHTTDGKHTSPPIVEDPNFFYDSSLAGDPAMNPGSSMWAFPGAKPTGPRGAYTIADNWRAAATPFITVDKADLITLTRDGAGKVMAVRPLVTFTPTYVQNDPGVPTSLENTANEAPSPAPVTYQSQYTHWSEPFRVLIYRNPATLLNPPSGGIDPNQDPLSLQTLDYYEYVYLTNPTTGVPLTNPDGSFQFKIVHETGVAPGSAPPTLATLQGQPDVGPQPDPVTGFWKNPNLTASNVANLTNNFYAFTIDPTRGVVNFAFPSTVIVNDGMSTPLACFYDPVRVNGNLVGFYGKRYVDLREPLQPVSVGKQPLNTGNPNTPLGIFTNGSGMVTGTPDAMVPQVRIVPGSERVYGPDQRPGPNYGYRIQYTRVSSTAGTVGLNEYKINYEDIPNAVTADTNDPGGNQNDPRAHIGYIEFNSLPDSDANPNQPFPITSPPPYSLPLFKADSNGNVNSLTSPPSDPVEITYNFQVNRPNDVVKVDYLTRDSINIVMEARLYEPSTNTAQVTDLTEKIKVRNLQH